MIVTVSARCWTFFRMMAAAGVAVMSGSAEAQSIIRGPYLQNATTNSIEVRWRTDVPTASTVRYGIQLSQQELEAEAASPTTEHAITLSGLTPDTRHFYSIYLGGTLLAGGAGHSFVTPPMSGRPTRIWAIGDVGTASFGSSAPLEVRNAYQQFTGERPTDVWLMLGDNAYFSGTDTEYQAAVFDVFPELLRTTPVWSTIGNHETYSPDGLGNIAYTSIFSLPQDGRAGGTASGTEHYYSFDYGSIHFVCLDSELSDRSANGPMLTWLEEDLGANTKDWTIAFWHSPPYTKGSHDSDFESNLVLMRENALPILESYGVDLVLCGHSHSYERSHLLNGHYGSSSSLSSSMVIDAGGGRSDETGAYLKSSGSSQEGTVYAVAGSAGQTSGGQLNHPAMFLSLNQLGSLVIDVDGRRMDVKFLRETGAIDDRFTIEKGDVPARIVAGPASQTAVIGRTVHFDVAAAGTPPLTYQWTFNEQAIVGATGAVLTIANIQLESAGNYAVAVSNQFGGELSFAAVLSVIEAPTNCAPPGLVGWWPLDQSPEDLIGANAANLSGDPVYGLGKVEAGLSFDGIDDFGKVDASSALDVGLGSGMTVELWIKPATINSTLAMLEWSDTGSLLGAHFHISTLSSGDLFANLIGRSGTSHWLWSPGNQVVADQFQHVALTYDKASGVARMYRNGNKITEGNLGTFDVETRPDVYFGRRVIGGVPYRFKGIMDEIGIHNRALSAEEVAAIFAADSAGRCPRATPAPPRITTQPQALIVYVGSTATFSVEALGAGLLQYQWMFGGNELVGKTNSVLVLNSVQSNHAGAYAVRVTSPFGQAVSSNATLLVNALPGCAPAVSGLVGWWPMNQSADDLIGGNATILTGSPLYALAKVDEGLMFDGIDDSGRVPASSALDVGAGNGLTVEMWIKPAAVNSSMTLAEWSDTSSTLGAHFTINTGSPGNIYANLISRTGQSHSLSSAGSQLVESQFQHVALTYDKTSGLAKIYRNGTKVAEANLGSFIVETRPDLYIGRRILGGEPYRFRGVMDEIAVYARALSGAEIVAIHGAGAAGRCYDAAPSILSQPTSITATLGQTADFAVSVIGTKPLSYQWYFGEAPVPDGTNRTLTLSNLGFAQAGPYRVVAGNGFGSVTSAVATLTVNYPAAIVQVVSVETLAAGLVEVPVQLIANGNENALSFSLGFDPVRLTFISAAIGAGAEGGALVVNTTNGSNGQVGVAVALPPGQTFGAGTQIVATVTLAVGPSGNPISLPVAFGDVPIVRRLSNVSAVALPAQYVNGTVSVLPSTVRAGAVETVTGGSVGVPVSLLALGNENAVSFSLSFVNSILAFAGVQAGSGLPPEASILINTNSAGLGRVGISVALPAGTSFARGPQELVQVNFEVATVLIPLTTPIQFGDSPTIRQVANQNAQPIPAVYQAGSVSVVSVAFEADIAPRPGGDQILSVIDWVQAGRFAAALDTVDVAEFQRVDCAPRATRGNGVISVADWVQAGRYSAGLDPITGIGGPAEPSLFSPASAGNGSGGCVVRISNTNVLPGGTLQVPVTVSATGAENALGFSLSFDAAKLRFVAASKLSPISTATLNLNVNDATAGKVGVVFALPTGATLSAGNQDVMLLLFTAAPAVSGSTTLGFGDVPVLREAVSVTANTVSSTFAAGEITLGPPPVFGPPVNITRSSDSVVIFWSATATGFELYASEAPQGGAWTKVTTSPIEIGGQKIVSLPTAGTQRYFRLRKP